MRSGVGHDSDPCFSYVPRPPALLSPGRRRLADRVDFSDDCKVGLSAAQTEAPGDVKGLRRPSSFVGVRQLQAAFRGYSALRSRWRTLQGPRTARSRDLSTCSPLVLGFRASDPNSGSTRNVGQFCSPAAYAAPPTRRLAKLCRRRTSAPAHYTRTSRFFWRSPIAPILIRMQISLAGIGKRFYGSQLSLVIVSATAELSRGAQCRL